MTVDADTAQAASFADVLRLRARRRPDATAFVFHDDAGERALTFAELDRRAEALAADLRAGGAERRPVLVLHPPGLDYVVGIFGCLYAGAVAVPAYPPDPVRPRSSAVRLRTLLRDARPARVLGAPAVAAALDEARAGRVPAMPEDVAILQYTSGSTAAPRGVMLTHENLLHNSEVIRRTMASSEATRSVMWLPPYHDMGLIGGVLQPVYAGFACVLMSPLTFLRQPLAWLQAMSEHRATASGAPDFAFDLCVRRIPEEARAGLDLSAWEVAFDGSEPVRAETLDAFAAAFGAVGFRRDAFRPCYGLAEATLIVTGRAGGVAPPALQVDRRALVGSGRVVPAAAGDRGSRAVVSCGPPVPGCAVAIADPATRIRLPEGRVGEIWTASPSVAAGYWQRPRETEAAFGAVLWDSGEGPFLRTGDLGFMVGGELYVTGRRKDVLVIAGRNYDPVDVERACEAAGLPIRRGCGAAFTFAGHGRERLAVVYEVADGGSGDHAATIRGVRRAVAAAVDAAVDAVVLIRRGTLPKTSSGKVQRGVCREQFAAGELDVVARWRSDEADNDG